MLSLGHGHQFEERRSGPEDRTADPSDEASEIQHTFLCLLQIQLTTHRDDGPSGGNQRFTLSITSPRQGFSPPTGGTSPESVSYLGTSPPTQIRISCPGARAGTSSSSELQPVHVQVTHGTQRFRAFTPVFSRSGHYRSTSDVVENIRGQDLQSPRQPKVRFESTPNVDCVELPGFPRPQTDPARKITSNPEIFAQQMEKVDAAAGPSGRSSNPAVHPADPILSSTNPFNPNYKEIISRATTANKDAMSIPPPENSDTNVSTLVKAGDKTIDVSAFVPMIPAQSSKVPETDPQQDPPSKSSSFVVVDSKVSTSDIDLRDFDPIASPSSDSTATPVVQSPASVMLPAIPPPPPAHRRTPRTSESIDADVAHDHAPHSQPTSARDSAVSQPSVAPDGSSSGSMQSAVSSIQRGNLDAPSGDASSARPTSPATPDADGIFVMTDLSEDDTETTRDST